jgi:hypothetical protein
MLKIAGGLSGLAGEKKSVLGEAISVRLSS